MPDRGRPDPKKEDIVYEDRRISRPDASLPDWESPDTTYRPIPIVWFTGALITQVVGQAAIFLLFGHWLRFSDFAVIAIAFAASVLVWEVGMKRGLSTALRAWRIATFVILAFFFGLTALSVLA